MRSLRSRADEEEQMDAPDLPQAVYGTVLADLARVNRITLASRPTLNFLARALGNRDSFRLLDVGFGQGDMLRAIACWAYRHGIDANLTGIDLNPNSETSARAITDPALPIIYQTGDYNEMAGENYDFIISSLVTHHMTESQRADFLRFMEDEARVGWMVNDLHRHVFAFVGFPILARLFGWHPIVREDGQLSIARSFRPDEWRVILSSMKIRGGRVSVVRRFPFRLCVERIH